MGVQMSTIVAVLGAAGAAIALALKDSLANIAGGVMIIVTKPFSRDDYIDIGTVSGKVKDIDLFLTTLRTYDNKTITVQLYHDQSYQDRDDQIQRQHPQLQRLVGFEKLFDDLLRP